MGQYTKPLVPTYISFLLVIRSVVFFSWVAVSSGSNNALFRDAKGRVKGGERKQKSQVFSNGGGIMSQTVHKDSDFWRGSPHFTNKTIILSIFVQPVQLPNRRRDSQYNPYNTKIVETVRENRRNYAKYHGYDAAVDLPSFVRLCHSASIARVLHLLEPLAWLKPAVIIECLHHYERVVWIDTDVLLLDFNKSIDQIMNSTLGTATVPGAGTAATPATTTTTTTTTTTSKTAATATTTATTTTITTTNRCGEKSKNFVVSGNTCGPKPHLDTGFMILTRSVETLALLRSLQVTLFFLQFFFLLFLRRTSCCNHVE